jgi:hypothetical protein
VKLKCSENLKKSCFSQPHVLKVQAGIIAEPCKPGLKKPDEPLQGDVSGVIDIVSRVNLLHS